MEQLWSIIQSLGGLGVIAYGGYLLFKVVIDSRTSSATAKRTLAEAGQIERSGKFSDEKDLTEINQGLVDQFSKLLENGQFLETQVKELKKANEDCEKKNANLETEMQGIKLQVKDILRSRDARKREIDWIVQRVARLAQAMQLEDETEELIHFTNERN